MILNDWMDWSFLFHLFLDRGLEATTLTASGFLGVPYFVSFTRGIVGSVFFPGVDGAGIHAGICLLLRYGLLLKDKVPTRSGEELCRWILGRVLDGRERAL